MANHSSHYKFRTLFFFFALGWTALLFGLFLWNMNKHREHIENNAIKVARTSFNKDLSFRRWGTLHGGVYAPVSEKYPPNKYLTHVSERDIVTPKGVRLTLINPAYMLRQINEISEGLYGISGHLTSLKLLNPDNVADGWERLALESFEKGAKEFIEFAKIEGKDYLRFMRPLYIEKGCLKCHRHQNYKIGDVRGGVSVTLLLTEMLEAKKDEILAENVFLVFIWLLGLSAVGFGFLNIRSYVKTIEDGEKALLRSQNRFEAAQKIAHVGSWDWKLSDNSLWWSSEIYRIFGVNEQNFKPDYDACLKAVHPDDRRIVEDSLSRALAGDAKHSVDHRIITPDGEVKIVHEEAEIRRSSSGEPVSMFGTTQDITARKKADEDVARLFTAIEQAAETIIITDIVGAIQYVNPAFEQVSGYSKEEAIGKNPRILRSGAQNNEFYKEMWDTITSGSTWKGHLINKKKNGELYEEDVTISPIFDVDGAIFGYVAVKHDVTREGMLEKQIRQSQKMEAMGTMAGGIAHDFNNILTAIIGYSEMAAESAPKDSEEKEFIEEALKASLRAKELVKQILTFSKRRETELKPLKLNIAVTESLKFFRASLPATIELAANIDESAGQIMGDATQISQVVLNLCTNAEYAMRDKGGVLSVTLASIEVDRDFASAHQALSEREYIHLTITDTGVGIDAETQDRVFEPFFSTKPSGEGTGMGLAVVHGIIRSFGGAIFLESEPGQGTIVNVYLPKIERETKSDGATEVPIAGGDERILLVDDERVIVSMWQRSLEKIGYSVTATTLPKDALSLFTASPDAFDIVITDQTMPNMTGVELASKIAAIKPGMPVILCSGHGPGAYEESAKEAGVKKYLIKPMTKRTLAQAIRDVLDSVDSG